MKPPAQQRVDGSKPAPKPEESVADPAGAAEDNGFGNAVAWRKYDVAMEEAKASGKPLMMVVHTSWCGRCKALKPSFSRKEVAELNKERQATNASFMESILKEK